MWGKTGVNVYNHINSLFLSVFLACFSLFILSYVVIISIHLWQSKMVVAVVN